MQGPNPCVLQRAVRRSAFRERLQKCGGIRRERKVTLVAEAGLVTILFTDLVGSTELASVLGDVAADGLRRQHFAHLREAMASTGGTEVKTIGDSVMVTYKGAADALAGGVAMQRAVERHNRGVEDHRLEIRVGISAGDASFEDGDFFGTPVVEASRLCADAAGGQILVSDLVARARGFPL